MQLNFKSAAEWLEQEHDRLLERYVHAEPGELAPAIRAFRAVCKRLAENARELRHEQAIALEVYDLARDREWYWSQREGFETGFKDMPPIQPAPEIPAELAYAGPVQEALPVKNPTSQLAVPKFDLDALVALQQANVDTVIAAQKILFDLAQTLARWQAEFLKEVYGKVEAAYVEEAKAVIEKAVADAKKRTDLALRAQKEVVGVLTERMTDNLVNNLDLDEDMHSNHKKRCGNLHTDRKGERKSA